MVKVEVYNDFKKGCYVTRTKTMAEDAGWIHLVADDQVKMEKDYEKIMEQMDNIWEIEEGENIDDLFV